MLCVRIVIATVILFFFFIFFCSSIQQSEQPRIKTFAECVAKYSLQASHWNGTRRLNTAWRKWNWNSRAANAKRNTATRATWTDTTSSTITMATTTENWWHGKKTLPAVSYLTRKIRMTRCYSHSTCILKAIYRQNRMGTLHQLKIRNRKHQNPLGRKYQTRWIHANAEQTMMWPVLKAAGARYDRSHSPNCKPGASLLQWAWRNCRHRTKSRSKWHSPT